MLVSYGNGEEDDSKHHWISEGICAFLWLNEKLGLDLRRICFRFFLSNYGGSLEVVNPCVQTSCQQNIAKNFILHKCSIIDLIQLLGGQY